jgi:hypothetical protein
MRHPEVPQFTFVAAERIEHAVKGVDHENEFTKPTPVTPLGNPAHEYPVAGRFSGKLDSWDDGYSGVVNSTRDSGRNACQPQRPW